MQQVGHISRRRAFDRDWTKGNILRNLLLLSWPMLISNTLMMLGPTIDMVWVGKLGSASIAGVGVAGVAVMLVMVAMMGLIMGMRAMVARFVGAGDLPAANQVVGQAFILSATLSLVIAAVGVFFTEAILGLFGLEAAVVTQGAAYMRIQFLGQAAMAFRIMSDGVMQASGDTMTPMKQSVIYRLFHVVLCPFLIFGWWIFPRMGVSGAAITSVISQTLGTMLGLWVLFTGRSRLRLNLENFRLDLNIMWRMVRIGLPALVSGIQRVFSQFFLMYFMAPFGTLAVAAHSINQRIEMVLVMPAMAFGMAAGVLVGQNLGAVQPERAEKSVWLAVGLVEGIMVIISAAILLWAEGVACLFSPEPALVELAATFIRISVAGFILLGLMFVLMQSLSGAGDTMPTMIVSVVTVWAVVLPLAYFLPKITELGMYGIRWAIVSEMVVGAIIFTIYFQTGRWKRKKI